MSDETPTQIIEALTPSKPLNLLQGSDTPAHANAQAPVRTAQVIRWRGITKLDLPCDQVLGAALEDGLKCAIVIGYTSDGEEYFASSLADGADVLWLLERLKMRLLMGSSDPDEV